MLVARNNCSASIARASRCGQVALPKASSRSAPAPLGLAEAVGAADQEARLALARRRASARACRAKASEPSCSPFSSSRMVTLFSAGGGSFPPLSGSSVTFTGQAIRFR